MKNIYHLTFLFSLAILFTACVNKKNIPQPTKKQEPIKSKKVIEKAKKVVDLKQIQLHKTCNKYRTYLTHSKSYILNEFKNAYLNKKDITGAQAQLFLIENNSPTPFASNINKALTSYNKYYELAKKSKCKLHKYTTTPLSLIKLDIKKINK